MRFNKLIMIKRILFSAGLSLFLLIGQECKAQLFNNGPLSTGSVASSGFAAPSGYTWSELQNNAGNSSQANSTAGLPAYFMQMVLPITLWRMILLFQLDQYGKLLASIFFVINPSIRVLFLQLMNYTFDCILLILQLVERCQL